MILCMREVGFEPYIYYKVEHRRACMRARYPDTRAHEPTVQVHWPAVRAHDPLVRAARTLHVRTMQLFLTDFRHFRKTMRGIMDNLQVDSALRFLLRCSIQLWSCLRRDLGRIWMSEDPGTWPAPRRSLLGALQPCTPP